ncbi:MAG: hypothetical protein AAB596_00685 [Patescibacteria group bacterium]
MPSILKKEIFKAYDIRGKYPKKINEKIVTEIIKKIISPKFKKIAVACDARLSSPKLYATIINQIKIQDKKTKIFKIGLSTTPMFYFTANKLKADLGIMVTASHNPKEYNGLKIIGKNAAPISGKEILRLIS